MIIILYFTIAIILLYLFYPIFLKSIPKHLESEIGDKRDLHGVTLILLTCNGSKYLKEKIKFLSDELADFKESEFIIIDDNSNDGTYEILEELDSVYNIKIIRKNEHTGIANSMNYCAEIASFDFIIFCDQRQKLAKNILKNIIEPLRYEEIGAASGYISNLDKQNKTSLLRKHENFIKVKESRAGCLIGVYGPLYAIKKSCYSKIPDYIILDDLYLSLKILSDKKIVLVKSCTIIDENFSVHYNLKRSRRYLLGLMQILKEKDLFVKLSFKLKLMLFWHKYIRLLIPPLLFLSYIILGFISVYDILAFNLYGLITFFFLIPIVFSLVNFHTQVSDLIRTNIYYFLSIISIFAQKFYYKIFPTNK